MSALYPTPHIHATPDDLAKTVLMPGDPLRAEFVAKNYLKDAVLFNNVRGIQGYTGTWKGKRVSVMASGMGMPSIGIYSYELFHFFGVENILRIGSAGALSEKVALRDVVLGMGACTNSAYSEQYGLSGSFAPIADFGLLQKAVEESKKAGAVYHVGNLLSSDTFYRDAPLRENGALPDCEWGEKMGVMAVEMEAAALYMNAARYGKRALAICTISDNLIEHTGCTAEERQNSFTDMMTLALETAVKLENI
jgi:purine-nucleoside phosphorylase